MPMLDREQDSHLFHLFSITSTFIITSDVVEEEYTRV
jgi:hypothetical protein